MDDDGGALWVFGYGSLIWRPEFKFTDSTQAELHGYERRFCQASHDHRGTVRAPGRVVTLAPAAGSVCTGVAYQLPKTDRESILEYLDEREQDGYERIYASLRLSTGSEVSGLTWIAREGNPSWRAGESMDEVTRVIADSHGPSGSNREYLFRLEQALASLGMPDPHVSELSERVRGLLQG